MTSVTVWEFGAGISVNVQRREFLGTTTTFMVAHSKLKCIIFDLLWSAQMPFMPHVHNVSFWEQHVQGAPTSMLVDV